MEQPKPEATPAKRAYKTKKRIARTAGRKARRDLDDDTKARIREEYKEGKSQADLAEKYGVSSVTVYRIVKSVGPIAKPRKHNQVPLKEIHGFRCLNCGHTFKIVLSKLDAYCPKPTCNKSTDLEQIDPEEVV